MQCITWITSVSSIKMSWEKKGNPYSILKWGLLRKQQLHVHISYEPSLLNEVAHWAVHVKLWNAREALLTNDRNVSYNSCTNLSIPVRKYMSYSCHLDVGVGWVILWSLTTNYFMWWTRRCHASYSVRGQVLFISWFATRSDRYFAVCLIFKRSRYIHV